MKTQLNTTGENRTESNFTLVNRLFVIFWRRFLVCVCVCSACVSRSSSLYIINARGNMNSRLKINSVKGSTHFPHSHFSHSRTVYIFGWDEPKRMSTNVGMSDHVVRFVKKITFRKNSKNRINLFHVNDTTLTIQNTTIFHCDESRKWNYLYFVGKLGPKKNILESIILDSKENNIRKCLEGDAF